MVLSTWAGNLLCWQLRVPPPILFTRILLRIWLHNRSFRFTVSAVGIQSELSLRFWCLFSVRSDHPALRTHVLLLQLLRTPVGVSSLQERHREKNSRDFTIISLFEQCCQISRFRKILTSVNSRTTKDNLAYWVWFGSLSSWAIQ